MGIFFSSIDVVRMTGIRQSSLHSFANNELIYPTVGGIPGRPGRYRRWTEIDVLQLKLMLEIRSRMKPLKVTWKDAAHLAIKIIALKGDFPWVYVTPSSRLGVCPDELQLTSALAATHFPVVVIKVPSASFAVEKRPTNGSD